MQWHCRALWMVLLFGVLAANSQGQQKKNVKEIEQVKRNSETDVEDVENLDNSVENTTSTDNQSDVTTNSDTAVAPQASEATTTIPQGPDDSCFIISEDNKLCAAVKLEASISVNYLGKDGKNLTNEQNVPDEAKCSGECDTEPVVTLEWNAYKLSLGFNKIKDGDWWEMKSLQLEFSPAEVFKIEHEVKTVTLEAKEDDLDIFSAPINQSFSCSKPQTVPLFSESGMLSAYAVVNEARMQAYNVPSDFGPEYTCSSDDSDEEEKPKKKYRDDTAPIAVGSTLAILSIGVIAGYAIYRSLTNKKVEYATM